MEKRAVIAVVLSIAVFYVFSALFPQPQHKTAPVPVQGGISSAKNVAASAAVPAAPAPAVTAPANVRDVIVDTDLFTATFSTQGGALKRLVLKKYEETTGKPVKPVTLVDERNAGDFTLRTRAGGFSIDPAAVFAVDADSLRITGGDKKRLTFQWFSPQGIRLTKTYEFQGNQYRIVLNQQVTNTGGVPLSGNLQLVLDHRYDPAAQGRFEVNGPVYLADGKFISKTVKDVIAKEQTVSNGVTWSGFADKYFLSAVIGDGGKIASVSTKVNPSANMMESVVTSPQLTVNPGSAVDVRYELYFGPKDLDILKAQGSGLEQSLDLGWFSALAKPLLHVLKFFYKYTGNYGVAIIIITVILKMFFFPLTYKSYKSMKGMQKLQPKMNALKEKYKNDREAMNREIMKLYQEHKVNPLGGCLPMVVQIPVFFALYKALMFSIELRHAPFVFWIQDLAAKDPTYITPIIMGATMFVQQKMTPSNMDPAQQKIMLALPVVFTFMFINFPSGLVLYWLVNNILTIGQQYYINRQLAD